MPTSSWHTSSLNLHTRLAVRDVGAVIRPLFSAGLSRYFAKLVKVIQPLEWFTGPAEWEVVYFVTWNVGFGCGRPFQFNCLTLYFSGVVLGSTLH